MVDPRGSGPRIAPSSASTVAIGYSWSGNCIAVAGPRAMCAGDRYLQADGTVASEETFNRGGGQDDRSVARDGAYMPDVLRFEPDDGQMLTLERLGAPRALATDDRGGG